MESILNSCISGKCEPGSSVGRATDYGLDGPGSNPSGDEIFRLRVHPGSCVMGTGSFPGLSAAGAYC